MPENNTPKPKILIFSDYYLPGYKSGGGMRTIVNMVSRLGGRYDFRIVTRDHDGTGDLAQYDDVRIGEWNEVGEAQVLYLEREEITFRKMLELLDEVRPDLLYFNSFFATFAVMAVALRKAGRLNGLPILIAPCGELSTGALTVKPLKKKLFIRVAKTFALHGDIYWKASSDLEREEITAVKGRGGLIRIAPDLPPRTICPDFRPDLKPPKSPGAAKMVFLSRYSRKKNLKWLIEGLGAVEGNLRIDIIGPVEDEEYGAETDEAIRRLPPNVEVVWKGPVPHERVPETLAGYHFFILPTLGENFGHVFLEALAVGCPLIISDRTPWNGLEEKGIGVVTGLEDRDAWVEKINGFIRMDASSYSAMATNARDYAISWLADPEIERLTVELLDQALGERSGDQA